MPHGATREDIRPDRAERRVRLISAIARGRRWLDEIIAGSIIGAGQLAKRERRTAPQVNLTVSPGLGKRQNALLTALCSLGDAGEGHWWKLAAIVNRYYGQSPDIIEHEA